MLFPSGLIASLPAQHRFWWYGAACRAQRLPSQPVTKVSPIQQASISLGFGAKDTLHYKARAACIRSSSLGHPRRCMGVRIIDSPGRMKKYLAACAARTMKQLLEERVWRLHGSFNKYILKTDDFLLFLAISCNFFPIRFIRYQTLLKSPLCTLPTAIGRSQELSSRRRVYWIVPRIAQLSNQRPPSRRVLLHPRHKSHSL